MARSLRGLWLGALAASLALAPASAGAQSAPNFACQTQDLVIGAAEMGGVRVLCRVSGAPVGDQSLRLLTDRPEPLCEAALSNGIAECIGTLITRGPVEPVVAELEPSGTRYQVLPPPVGGGQSGPALQYTPLPSDTGPPSLDEPPSDPETP